MNSRLHGLHIIGNLISQIFKPTSNLLLQLSHLSPHDLARIMNNRRLLVLSSHGILRLCRVIFPVHSCRNLLSNVVLWSKSFAHLLPLVEWCRVVICHRVHGCLILHLLIFHRSRVDQALSSGTKTLYLLALQIYGLLLHRW